MKSPPRKTPNVGRPASHKNRRQEDRTDGSSSSNSGRTVRETARPALISENSAPRVRPVGRPREIEPFTLEKMRLCFPNVTTDRGLQNKYFAARAYAALGDDERFAWAKKRTCVLTELGRIKDHRGLAYVAAKLCKNPPGTAREAMAIIQSLRHSRGLEESAFDLSIQIRRLVRNFRRENPRIRGWDIANALQLVRGRIKGCERDVAHLR